MKIWKSTQLAAELEKRLVSQIDGQWRCMAYATLPNRVRVVSRRFSTQRTIEMAEELGLKEIEFQALGAFVDLTFEVKNVLD